jgi:hypothetical protein
VWTIDIWRIDPAATGFQHVHNAADDTPVIDPRLASRIGWQKGQAEKIGLPSAKNNRESSKASWRRL